MEQKELVLLGEILEAFCRETVTAAPTRHLPGKTRTAAIRKQMVVAPTLTPKSGNYLDPFPYTEGL